MEYYQPQPLPPKKDSTWLKVIVAGIGCFALLIGIGAFVASKFYFSMRAPTRTIQEHLSAINEGNFELAYTKFSESYKRENSFQKFRDDMEEFSSLLPAEKSSFGNISIVNDHASVEGTLTGRDGAIFPVQYELMKENGVWRITKFHWTSPGERIRV
jgi:uncharacterized protein DUF4864